MSGIFKNNILFVNDEPVIHEGSTGYAEMVQLCWVWVGDKRIQQPVVSRVYAKDLKNLSERIRVNGFRVATMDSYFEKSYGDEHTECGVLSGTKGGKAHFITGSPTWTDDGAPLVRRGDLIICNNGNSAPGPWIEDLDAAPLFASKCRDTSVDENKSRHTLNIAVFLQRVASQAQSIPFEHAILVQTSDDDIKRYRPTGGVVQTDQCVSFAIDIQKSEYYWVKECINDPYGGMYEVLLGRARVQSDIDPGDIILVGVDFRVYLTAVAQVSQIRSLYLGTYLYLFKDGYIWREFTHPREYKNLCEVNLQQHHGKDIRPTDIAVGRGILLTIRDLDGEHDYGYAISHVQWDWETIEKMGGVEPGKLTEEMNERQARRVTKLNVLQLFGSTPGIQDDMTCPGGVAWAQYPEEKVPEKIHPREMAYQYPHPAVGTIFLKDPLGNALIRSYLMSNKHNEYVAYLEENEGLYQAGELVGSVLDALERHSENYRDEVRDEERLAFMEQYRLKIEHHEAYMREASIELIAFMKQAEEMHVWDDDTDETVRASLNAWANIGFGLNATAEGRAYFRELFLTEDSTLDCALKQMTRFVRDADIRDLTIKLLDVCSDAVEGVEEGVEKIVHYVNLCFPDEVTITISNARLTDIFDAQIKKADPMMIEPHSSVYVHADDHVRNRHAPTMPDSGPHTQIFRPELTGDYQYYLNDRQSRLGSTTVKIIRWNDELIQHITQWGKPGSTMFRVFTLLSALNVAYVYRKISTEGYALNETEKAWVAAELYVAIVDVFRYMPKATGKSLYSLMQHQWKIYGKRAAFPVKAFMRAGTGLSLILSGKDGAEAYQSGEYGLAIGYGSIAVSGSIDILISFMSAGRALFFLNLIYIKILSLAIALIGFCMVFGLIRNDYEKWLFTSLWGRSSKREMSYASNLDSLLRLTSFVHFQEVKYLNPKHEEIVRALKNHEYNVLPVGFKWSDMHEQLRKSTLLITIKVQHVSPSAFTVRMMGSKDLLDDWHDIKKYEYKEWVDRGNDIDTYHIEVPGSLNATFGGGFDIYLQYLSSTAHQESSALIESCQYAIRYLHSDYTYHANLVTRARNKSEESVNA